MKNKLYLAADWMKMSIFHDKCVVLFRVFWIYFVPKKNWDTINMNSSQPSSSARDKRTTTHTPMHKRKQWDKCNICVYDAMRGHKEMSYPCFFLLVVSQENLRAHKTITTKNSLDKKVRPKNVGCRLSFFSFLPIFVKLGFSQQKISLFSLKIFCGPREM